MASLNKVMLIGRLGQDPELRYTQSGHPVASLSLATDESYTDKQGNRVEQTEWHRISVWGKAAENVANYLSKGSQCFVEGSLQTRKWQDKTGADRYTTEIKGFRVQFLDPKGYSPNAGQSRQNQYQQPAQQPSQQNSYNNQEDDLGPAFPSEASGMDDVPF